MGKSRPINRRPWRRPPWRKSSRPRRWISLNSGVTTNADGTYVTPWYFSAANVAGAFPNVTLAAGQIDVEPWADNQEVTIDRIVGDITIQGFVFGQHSEAPAAVWSPGVIYRLGMLVQEEGDATSAPAINLFSDEHLEDFEWMWLHEGGATNWNYMHASAQPTIVAGMGFTKEIHLDLNVRRKLGQTDTLLLYAQAAPQFGAEFDTSVMSVTGSHVLRSIFMSK